MERKPTKTGQHIDIQKWTLVVPALSRRIAEIPGLPQDISLLDIGTGDASSVEGLILSLVEKKRIVSVGLVDADIEIFPDLVTTATSGVIDNINTQIVQVGERASLAEFLRRFEGQYDVATCQLVMHQIENHHAASYLMYMAEQALKPDGEMFIVNLHPDYLKYIAENEPKKFSIDNIDNGVLTGTYAFDSTGSASVYSRDLRSQLMMSLALGFELVDFEQIIPEALSELKPRYKDMTEKKVPIFYLLQLRKNPKNFVLSTEGLVQQVKRYNKQWTTVTFVDGDEVRIPGVSQWKKIKEGDQLILQQTVREGLEGTILNYWVINPKQEIDGGQLVVSLPR